MGVHGDGYKDLTENEVTYGASGVLFDGGKWYLRCVGYVVMLFVAKIFSGGGGIGKMDGLCGWVEM